MKSFSRFIVKVTLEGMRCHLLDKQEALYADFDLNALHENEISIHKINKALARLRKLRSEKIQLSWVRSTDLPQLESNLKLLF